MEDNKTDTLLEYGSMEGGVREAIAQERVYGMNLTDTNLEVSIPDIDQLENEEYVSVRRNGIGGSDISVVLGVNPFKTVEELIEEKSRTYMTEEERAVGDLTAVKKGRDLEPLIINKFEKAFNTITFKPKDMYKFKEYPYLALNYDGMTRNNNMQYIPAEIKVVTKRGERHYDINKAIYHESSGFQSLPDVSIGESNNSIETKAMLYGIPPYYYTQLQMQMFGVQAPYGYLSVLFDTTWEMHTFLVWKDEKIWSEMVVKGYKVWEKVELQRQRRGFYKNEASELV